MAEVNEGVQIILGRMESNPEEFFDAANTNNKWRWIFSENMREVMTEPEKAAIFEGMRKVRRLEITAKAVATVLPQEEEEREYRYKGKGLTTSAGSNGTSPSPFGAVPNSQPKKQTMTRSEWELFKTKNGTSN